MSLRKIALGSVLLTAVFATAPALTEPPAQTPAPPTATPEAAPRRSLRITGRLEKVYDLTRKWEKYSKDLDLPWYSDPLGQAVTVLLASRVSDAGNKNLPVGPQQPVCWCARGRGCDSLRVLSVQGGCGRLETPGDGKWDRHLSSSEWKTMRYGDAFIALNLDMPSTAKVVALSILANRCGDAGSYMFPITSTHTDINQGNPTPFYLLFSPRGSKDFSASIELRLLADGGGAFDVEVKNVTMNDRDGESRASTAQCIKEHGSPQCRYVSLEEDLDGLQAGVATWDATRCQ